MDKYLISYRGKVVKVVTCYTDNEAKLKAKYCYSHMCPDDNRDKKVLSVITPSGKTLKVF